MFVQNLVLDANGFFSFKTLEDFNQIQKNVGKIYTTPSIINEIKNKKQKEIFEVIRSFIQITTPTSDSDAFILKTVSQSTDRRNLSKADRDILALTYELSLKFPEKQPSESLKLEKNSNLRGFFKSEKNDEDAGEMGWVGPGADKNQESVSVKVACLTSDFDIQNVLLKLSLNIYSNKDNMLINTIKFFVTMCRYCGLECRRQRGDTCPTCGLRGLDQISASCTKGNEKKLHLSQKYKIDPKKYTRRDELAEKKTDKNIPKLKRERNFSKNVFRDDFGVEGDIFPKHDLTRRTKKMSVK